jgi:hypothetical protein
MTSQNIQKALHWNGLPLAILGVAIVGLGEWFLLFNPAGGYDFETYKFLVGKSPKLINLGHWLSVLFAPFYLWGYYVLSRVVEKKSWAARAWLPVSIYTFTLAGMWISSRSYIAFVAQSIAANPESSALPELLHHITGHADPLLYMAWGGLLAVSGIFSYLVATRQLLLPKWMAFFPPLAILPINFLLYFLAPTVGVYILPTAMNITHVIFFGMCLWGLKKKV